MHDIIPPPQLSKHWADSVIWQTFRVGNLAEAIRLSSESWLQNDLASNWLKNINFFFVGEPRFKKVLKNKNSLKAKMFIEKIRFKQYYYPTIIMIKLADEIWRDILGEKIFIVTLAFLSLFMRIFKGVNKALNPKITRLKQINAPTNNIPRKGRCYWNESKI